MRQRRKYGAHREDRTHYSIVTNLGRLTITPRRSALSSSNIFKIRKKILDIPVTHCVFQN